MVRYYVCLLMVVLVSACTSKQEKKESASDPVTTSLPTGNAVEGKILYANCATCHGASGEGNKKLNGPALANTDDWYLYRQVMNFRKGIRGFSQHDDTLGFQMAAMAKVLKDSIEASHVVAYIKTMPKATLFNLVTGDIIKGKRTYETICGSCHGQNANGNVNMHAPRLNGLDDWYMQRQMFNFKNSIRGAHADDKLGAQMVPMMALLPNDQAVKDVIAYINSTAQPVLK